MRVNPIKNTVDHYMEVGTLRWLRRQKREQLPRKKEPRKSSFVRFFENLENHGPLSPHSAHERWTKKIRHQMEREGTWPVGEQEFKIEIVAEYLSRLLRCFWDEKPDVKYRLPNSFHNSCSLIVPPITLQR